MLVENWGHPYDRGETLGHPWVTGHLEVMLGNVGDPTSNAGDPA